jgi:hypothetical protein
MEKLYQFCTEFALSQHCLGAEFNIMPESKQTQGSVEKMYLTEWLEVRKHSRTSLLKLREEDVNLYDIRPGDQIRVQLQVIKKLPRDESEK